MNKGKNCCDASREKANFSKDEKSFFFSASEKETEMRLCNTKYIHFMPDSCLYFPHFSTSFHENVFPYIGG